MLRRLPPAGQSIPVRSIIRAFRGRPAEAPLKGFFYDRPVFLLCSGTAALTLSLSSLKRNGRDEIIFPAYTCPSLLAAVLRAGLKPVLCDLEPCGFGMDLEQLKNKIGPGTLGIIAVHLFGITERIEEIKQIAGEEVAVIEDATQAFVRRPAKSGQVSPGGIGDMGVLSFRRGKPLSCLSGGALVVNNPAFQEEITDNYNLLYEDPHEPGSLMYFLYLLVYSFLFHPRLYWIPLSLPFLRLGETVFTTEYNVRRLNPIVMNLASQIFARIDELLKIRTALASNYTAMLEPFRGNFIYLPDSGSSCAVLLRYPVVFKEKRLRDFVYAELAKRGLGASVLYPSPVNGIKGVPPQLFGKEKFPRATLVSENLITLPLHEHVTTNDGERIESIISACLGRNR